MRAIILAAGVGKRLGSVISNRPKCLIDFGGVSLLRRQIDAFAYVGVQEFVIVVGYMQEAIRAHVATLPHSFVFIENPIYDRTNTLYSLWLARERFRGGFFYANADVLFDYRMSQRLSGGPLEASRLACVKGRCGEEEVKVVAEGDRIVEIGKDMEPARCYGEFMGVARFAAPVAATFAVTLDACARDQRLWRMFFEYAVNLMAPTEVLACVDTSDLPAIEIDFPADLQRARESVLPKLIAPPCEGLST